MGMKLLKAWYHITALMKILAYKVMFGKKLTWGKQSTFRKYFSIYIEQDAQIEVGNQCFFNHGCSINALKKVKIGDGCIFGENVKIYDQNHRFADVQVAIKDQGFSVAEVTIGKHCWIGSNTVILKGVTIGDNCVIGAGCVISEDIPSNSVVTGNRIVEIKALRKKEN